MLISYPLKLSIGISVLRRGPGAHYWLASGGVWGVFGHSRPAVENFPRASDLIIRRRPGFLVLYRNILVEFIDIARRGR